ARAVTAGTLHADQRDGPEPAQPVQQIGVPVRGGREPPHAQQGAERIQRGGDMSVRVGVYAAGDDACVFYDVIAVPFLWLKGWHRTRWPPICETPASCPGQADRTGSAGGCLKRPGPSRRAGIRTTL